jgi:protein-arginine kinase
MNNVISTRVSVFRNIKDYKFENKLTQEQKCEIIKMLETVLKGKMSYLNINDADENAIRPLNDNVIILQNTKELFVGKDENIVINLFNGEHISVVCADEGFNKKTIEKPLSLVNTLASKIPFVFSDEYGYLMSDLAKVGAGLRIESNIMLSAIKSINKIDQVRQNVAKLGYSLNETKFPGVYTLSTTCNLGIGEKQICQDFESTLVKLQELETESAKMIDVSKHDEILDKALRSSAILNSAHMLNYDELFNMLVNLRIALNVGVVDMNLETINKLQKLVTRKTNDYISPTEMIELARLVKEILKGESHV